MERGTMMEKGGSTKRPLRRESPVPPPPPESAVSKSFSKPPDYVPPAPRIDVTGQTFLADSSLKEIDVAEQPVESDVERKRTSRPGSTPENAPPPETAREQEPKGPIFEAASNVAGKRGKAGLDVNPDTGTFIFVAGENAEPTAVEGIIDSALERMKESSGQQERAVSMAHGETSRDRASSIDTRLMSAASRGALDAVVRENAHKLARGDKASAIEVPPFVVGQVFNEEITAQEFYGDTRNTEDVIGTLVDKGTRGLEEQERASTQAVEDAKTKYDAIRAEVKNWLGGDPLIKWPTKSDLDDDESLSPEQKGYIGKVYNAQEALTAVGPTHKQLMNNMEIAKILARKLEETRQARLTQTDEQFEETYRELKNDPELAKLATENLPILLKRLREDIPLTTETAKDFAAPDLSPEAADAVKGSADKLNAFFKKIREPKTDTEKNAAAQAALTFLNSPSVQRLMDSPAERLALFQQLSYPPDANMELLLRSVEKATPKDPEKAQRLIEPSLSETEGKIADDLTYEMKRVAENPMALLKDPRFTSMSREGRFVVVQRLKNLSIVKPNQATELLQARRLMLRGKPGEALTVLKVGRDGKVTKIETGAKAGKSSEDLEVNQEDKEAQRVLSTTKRTVSQQANAAVDIGVQVGDQIIVIPSSAEEFVMGQQERVGTEGIEKILAELKGDPNRSAKANSERIKNTTERPHLVLRIPT
ncbi:MAG: hypothetical protein AAB974_02380 [Patescibacteria group bacterium]